MFDITAYWYRSSFHPYTFFLKPWSFLFAKVVTIRQWLYRTNKLSTHRFSIPVIVVGNLTVGGTGKTPFVIWLAQFLKAQGYCPGIVSRGVGGRKHQRPYWVTAQDVAATVGDEALLLQKHTQCPVVISVNRVAAVAELMQHTSCDIIISDDGLQHYRLARDIEIVMVDGVRRFGNQCLLPAGPLRESIKRLEEVDFVVVNGGRKKDEISMSLHPSQLISLQKKEKMFSLVDFPYRKIHAIAGIGHPQRFFNFLQEAGFEVIPHAFSDHYHYRAEDIYFADGLPVIMTEKDAVKCGAIAHEKCWYLPVAAKMDAEFETKLMHRLMQKSKR